LDLEGCGDGAWDEEALELTPTTREEVAECLKGIEEIGLRDREPIKCEDCGGSTFHAVASGYYGEVSLRFWTSSVGLVFGPGECEASAEEIWSSFDEGVQDDEGLEWIFAPFDCTSTIKCTKCDTELGLDFDPADAWDSYTEEDMESEFGSYYGDEGCYGLEWCEPRSLQVHFKDGVASPDDADHSDKAEDVAVGRRRPAARCPVCGEVDLCLFGGGLRTDSDGGYASGRASFENPTRKDFKNWDVNEFDWSKRDKGGGGDKISEWVNVGCSDGECWSSSLP
jgi:hypothetical protein